MFVVCLILFALPVWASDAPPTTLPEKIGLTNGAQFEAGWNYFKVGTEACSIGQILNEIQADGGGALEAKEIWVMDAGLWQQHLYDDATKTGKDSLLAFNSNQKFFFDLNTVVCTQNDTKRQEEIKKVREAGNKSWLDSAITGIKNQILSPFGLQKDIDVSKISAEFATFSDSLKVIGTTQLAETTIGGSLTVGLLHFDDLKAEISSLTGNVTINSNLNVIGDATVSGQLKSKAMETDGISLKDEITGEYYCVRMKNGEIDKTVGKCQ